MDIGQKIRQFRKRAGMSQLALETEIGLSPGHLSRIENGQIEPQKETIVNIAYALKLNTREIASLFGIEIPDHKHLYEEAIRILSTLNLREVLDRTVNDLIFKMGYLASVLFIIRGDRVYHGAMTMNNCSRKICESMNLPFEQLSVPLSKDSPNLMVRSILQRRVSLTYHTSDYTSPPLTKEVADRLQEMLGDRSNIIYPLYVEDEPLGAIVYIKKVYDDFSEERDTLEIISKQIAVAIRNAMRFEKVNTLNIKV